MSCYFRHLEETFKKAGLTIDADNRKVVDIIIHEMVGTHYKDCPTTWKQIEEKFETEESFIERLRMECQARNIFLEY